MFSVSWDGKERSLWERCYGLRWTRFRLIPLLSLLCRKTQVMNPQFQPSHPAGPISDSSWGHVILLLAEFCTCVMVSAVLNTEPVQSTVLANVIWSFPGENTSSFPCLKVIAWSTWGRFRESGGCLPAAVN